MIVILYIATIVVFSIAAMLLPVAILLLRMVSRWVTKTEPSYGPVPVWPSVLSAILLMILTRYVWQMLGYHAGWLLIWILALINLLCGGAYGANEGNKANSYGTMLGVILYGVFYH